VYAAHFAAGLAIKSRFPETPAWALLTGAFLPDFIWIAVANRGIEPTNPQVFFDDWSHSLPMVILWASLFAVAFGDTDDKRWWSFGCSVFSLSARSTDPSEVSCSVSAFSCPYGRCGLRHIGRDEVLVGPAGSSLAADRNLRLGCVEIASFK